MKKEKVKKLKIRKEVIICTIICFILILFSGTIFVYKNLSEKKTLQNIKSHYNTYAITNKESKIYKKSKDKYVKYGKISKDFELVLEKTTIQTTNQQYFKVKDEDYYVYYKDIDKKDKEATKNEIPNNYLVFNKNLKTKKTTRFITNNKYIEINKSYELPIEYIDDNNYYVNYLNNTYAIKKDETIEIIDSENTKENEATHISIIDYSNTSTDKLKEELDYLKTEGYYTINLTTYKEWLKSNIRLKDKAIVLTYDKENEEIMNNIKNYNFDILLTTDSDIKFTNNNSTTNKDSKLENLNRYVVKNSTSLDDFKKMCNGEKIIEKTIANTKGLPSTDSKASSIAVINYHFFYDSSLGEGCNENICLDTKKFREQLQFLKDNGYKTLKMEEFRAWMYGEIELPARSVLLTIDDGALGTGKHNGNKLIPILEEYDMYATLFLIAGWWDKNNYISDHLDVESHTFDMHTGNMCSTETRGAQLLCSTKEEVLTDLRKSIDILGKSTAFCFPFYAYNNSAIESVKEVGFKLAFIGENKKATRSVDKYKIPRYPIYNTTSLNQFINMIK